MKNLHLFDGIPTEKPFGSFPSEKQVRLFRLRPRISKKNLPDCWRGGPDLDNLAMVLSGREEREQGFILSNASHCENSLGYHSGGHVSESCKYLSARWRLYRIWCVRNHILNSWRTADYHIKTSFSLELERWNTWIRKDESGRLYQMYQPWARMENSNTF